MKSSLKHHLVSFGDTDSGFGSGIGDDTDPFELYNNLLTDFVGGRSERSPNTTSRHGTILGSASASQPGTPGGGNTGSTGSSVTSSSGSAPSTSPFVINITWDPSVQSAPQGFTAAVMSAVQYLESQFSNPVTINIDVGWGEIGGEPMGGDLGDSYGELDYYSNSQIFNALSANATKNAADASAAASLSGIKPTSTGYYVTSAEAKALGLANPTSSAIDGYVGIGSDYRYTYNDSSGVALGTYDLKGIVLHEMTEDMGRVLFTNAADPDVYELFNYSSPGVIDYSTTPGYFSINGGTTSLAAFNKNPAGDAGDWASSMTDDAADAFVSSGVALNFSKADLTAMDVLGWNADPPSAPTGVTFAAATNTLSKAVAATALNRNIPLLNISQTGGATGDTYSYTLGGPNTASFALSNMSGTETLVAAGTPMAGVVNGKLYALTVSATDTSGLGSFPSPADSLNIIVGSSGHDTIQVSSLANSSTPTFIYGLGGGDTINGSGMSGNLWLASGPGGDVMTGGSGTNQYMYSAVGDSTASSMDLITNFDAASDVIDFSGISTGLKYEGDLAGTTINAQSVAWQQSGGETRIYVNTGSSSASLSAANMEIGLQGTVALASKNFVL